jgi:hypothetical protein
MQWLGYGTIEHGEEAAGSRVICNEKKMGIGAFTGEALRSGNQTPACPRFFVEDDMDGRHGPTNYHR